MAVKIALGRPVKPDYTAIPRATYTDPETAGVGLRLDEATERGHDAFEETIDLESSAKGNVTESFGHATVVVDKKSHLVLGTFIAGPAAAEAIHESVLAIKTGVPIEVLADTIHAFPTTSRVLGSALSALPAASRASPYRLPPRRPAGRGRASGASSRIAASADSYLARKSMIVSASGATRGLPSPVE